MTNGDVKVRRPGELTKVRDQGSGIICGSCRYTAMKRILEFSKTMAEGHYEISYLRYNPEHIQEYTFIRSTTFTASFRSEADMILFMMFLDGLEGLMIYSQAVEWVE